MFFATLRAQLNTTAQSRSAKYAADASPDNPRYAYVYGVALHDSGSPQKSIAVLERALARFPNDRELMNAVRAYDEKR